MGVSGAQDRSVILLACVAVRLGIGRLGSRWGIPGGEIYTYFSIYMGNYAFFVCFLLVSSAGLRM